jgi:uncharacterized protein (TIGR03437 family)
MLAALTVAMQLPVLPQSVLNTTPSRIVGQPALDYRSGNPNVVEGREFLSPQNVVVDRSTNPPSLYVSDFGNNRVLGWRDALAFANGAPADIVLGQTDFSSTLSLGPGTNRTTGFTAPGALAVDSNGNLYVVDAGNNRILRFPKPFETTNESRLPDLVIGQPSLTTEDANAGGLSEKTVAIASGNSLGRTGLAFDSSGNLWFSDPLNHRVLRYPAAALEAGINQPAANLVLGQPDFQTNAAPPANADSRANKSVLRAPSGIAIDGEGRVYVSDELSRVVVFTPPYFNAKAAVRLVGLSTQPTDAYALGGPEGLTVIEGNRLAVADLRLNRITIYDPFPSWPAETAEVPSPPAKQIIGQSAFGETSPNRGRVEPNEATLNAPIGIFFSGTELFVADSGNHRVLVFPQQTTGASATRILGQIAFNFTAPNLIEGREMFLFNGFRSEATDQAFSDGGGVAIDTTSNPPRLYVADTFNNRILGYKDARKIAPGDRADIVIGQSDMFRALVNAPFNNGNNLNNSGLFRPTGLAVDKNGDLFVADSANGRVLRFPSPFNQTIPDGERRQANLVLGQLNFSQKIIDPSPRTMGYPFGLAFTGEGHLVVSDIGHNRVLMFRRPANADFANGQPADLVIGQPDFVSSGRGNAPTQMNGPRHLTIDTDDRLYVADTANNRVLVFDRVTTAANNAAPAFLLTGLSGPQAVYVSPRTGEIWVANTKANQARRYPRYDQLFQSTQSNYQISSSTPLALTQDEYGNLYVAEGINRVALFFNGLTYQVAGNYATRPLSPGTIAVVYPAGAGVQFSDGNTSFDQLPNPVPLPRTLSDVQVLLNNEPVPLYFVSPFQINFLVPMNAPNSGTGEIQVVKPSTGQVIVAGRVNFAPVSPALFVQGGFQEGQLAAINQDGKVNAPENPIKRGQVLQLFGTGQGHVSNAPPDGEPPSGPIPIDEPELRVVIGTDFVAPSDIQYSGLAPQLIGVWQINVRVPENVAPGAAIPVAVQLKSIPSTIADPSSNDRLVTTIAVVP